MNKFFLLSTIALLMVACQSKTEYTVKGDFVNEEFEGQLVYLEKMEDSDIVAIDTTEIIDGKFTFKSKIDKPEIRFISVGESMERPRTMFLAEPGTINVKYDDSFTISGTPTNDAYNDYMVKQNEFNIQARQLADQFNAASQDGSMNEELEAQIREDFNKVMEQNMAITQEFIKENIDNDLGQQMFLSTANMLTPEQQREILANANNEFKSNKNVERILENLKALEAVAVGKDYIDFTMKDPEGNEVSLSDYVGKSDYLFIDFWAAWCGPCISEMPNVVDAYNTYKDKGLEIVGVSFDDDKDKWLEAVKSLNMTWPQMSDLNGWDNDAVKFYAIQGIPHTILLDKEGKIIAKDLRGTQLKEKLAELMD